jgi:hypothetical protein
MEELLIHFNKIDILRDFYKEISRAHVDDMVRNL